MAGERIVSRPVVLHLRPLLDLTDEQFFTFCQMNHDLNIEQNASGEVIIMPPIGGETGFRNIRTSRYLDEWAERDNTGVAFDSSTGFLLPNGARCSPDGSWVHKDKLTPLTAEQKQRFLPLCPDFVLEIRSPSDNLALIQEKMEEYITNGARLGWLIDPTERKVYVYRMGVAEPEVQENPSSISGDPVMPGFQLDLSRIWEPGF